MRDRKFLQVMWMICVLIGCNSYSIEPARSPLITTPLILTAVSPLPTTTTEAGPTQRQVQTTAGATKTITSPIVTPTSISFNEARLCDAHDLQGSELGVNGASGRLLLSVHLINVSNSECLLQDWPQIQLTDRQGHLLDIAYSHYGEPTHFNVYPNDRAGFEIMWGNWCHPLLEQGAVIRISFAIQTNHLDILTGARGGGRCDVSTERSYVGISVYSR